jgi:nucleoid-associated protein EbfC
MLGGLGNLPGLFKQAKEMQSRMAEIQAEILAKRFDSESGGGAVKVTVDGKGTLVDIKIQPDATSDVELLEDMIKGAVAAASVKAQAAAKEEMAKLTGGLNIPGLSEMLGG